MAGKQGPETRLVNKMRAAAKEKYGERLVIVKHHGSEFAQAGVSDLLCCLDGTFIAVEVKAPENYGSEERAITQGPTVKQWAFLARVEKAGGTAVVCASVESFLAVLASVKNQTGPNQTGE